MRRWGVSTDLKDEKNLGQLSVCLSMCVCLHVCACSCVIAHACEHMLTHVIESCMGLASWFVGISGKFCPRKIFLAIHLKLKFFCFEVIFCSYFIRVIVIYKYLSFSIFETYCLSIYLQGGLSCMHTYKCLTFAVFVPGQKEAYCGKCFMWHFSKFKTEF